jgi:ABC-type antimicrobial peptide transport system permease subunit
MSEPINLQPPRWPVKLLRLFIKEKYLEEIEGDMEEVFHENREAHSLRIARRLYTLEMLKLLRPVLLKNAIQTSFLNQLPMFKNYFKISFRSLMKNPMTSFINVFGLSVAVGICLVVYAFMEYDYSIDQFHKNKNGIYLATFFSNREGVNQQYGMAPGPLGEALKSDFAQIKNVCRLEDQAVIIKYEDNVYHENIRYADPAFLQMFTFPLRWGVANSLADLNSIILSEDMATKYFGEENPLGQDVLIIFNDTTKKAFTVTGVARAFPKAHDIDFNFLINIENLRIANSGYEKNDWSKFVSATFVQVEQPADRAIIEHGSNKYKALQNQAQPDWAIASFRLEPLTTLHERSGSIKDGITHDYNVEGRLGMPIIAIFMIALACFNYINIAIVSAAKRLKEIGVRKAIGATRTKVITQFLTENIVVTSFALVIGIVLCYFIFLPWFVQFSGWQLELTLFNTNLWIFLAGLLVFTGLVSGMSPAFYIANFNTVKIFKGSLQFGKKNPLTKIFLCIQLVVACMMITAGVVFTQNNQFQNNRSWGYDQENVVYASVPDQPAFDQLKAVMSQNASVVSIAGSKDHLGKSVSNVVLRSTANQQYEVNEFAVGAHYVETMGLTVSEGRTFKEFSENDTRAIVVNELLVKDLNLVQPVGQQFEIDSVKYEIIGVLKDFHHKSFFNTVQPAIFRLATEADHRYLTLRVKSGNEQSVYADLQTQWIKLNPEVPFLGGHQADVWSNYFHSVNRSEKFNKVIASVAVLLASLGLYGLVTLNVSGRIKEFSIRKTLGAGAKNIASVIFRQYSLLIIISLIIGAPISYLFTKAYLKMLFAYPMPMGYSGIIIALLILMVVLLAVVSTQIRRVVKSNPLEGLKTE